MDQITLRKKIREYLNSHNSTHFMPTKRMWAAHVSLGYDIAETGKTEEEAIKRLISTIVGSKHYSEYFIKQTI